MSTENNDEIVLSAEEENKLITQRREKLAGLREKGNAFPNSFRRDSLAGDLLAHYEDKTKEELEEIRTALAENKNEIKLHILNNNFFETKKLLEHDDKGSNYLIYSPEAERDNQSNWLLDIQLYSSRFENSKISDIKSAIGIEGSSLDRFLEKTISGNFISIFYAVA